MPLTVQGKQVPREASEAGKWLRGPQLWESEESLTRSGRVLGPSRNAVAETCRVRKLARPRGKGASWAFWEERAARATARGEGGHSALWELPAGTVA